MVVCFLVWVLFCFFPFWYAWDFYSFLSSLFLKVIKRLINAFQRRKKNVPVEQGEKKKYVNSSLVQYYLPFLVVFFFLFHTDEPGHFLEYVYHFRGISDKRHHILPVFHSLICLKVNI